MAKYVVTHSCGHTEEVSLFGKESERERRIAWLEGQPCTECRAEEATGLTGSPKQRAWAADIREEAQSQLARDVDDSLELVGYAKALLARYTDTDIDDENLVLLRKAATGDVVESIEALRDLYDGIIAAHTDARWWIDHRDTASSRVWREAREAQPDLYTLDQVIIGIRYAKANIEHNATVASR